MIQNGIDEYVKIVERDLPVYLAGMPDPYGDLDKYVENIPSDDKCTAFPVEWFDVAALTALIRNHKDTKGNYEVNSYLVEMLSSMFVVAIKKLNFMDVKDAYRLAGMFAYDRGPEDHNDMMCIRDFCYGVKWLPYDMQNQVWYSFLMPILAYRVPYPIDKSNYLARAMVSLINRYGLMDSRGEHVRDLNVDMLKPKNELKLILALCEKDRTLKDPNVKYKYLMAVLQEFATVYLACLMQRTGTNSDFGRIAADVVSSHYIEYQTISQLYFNKKQQQEQPNE